MPRRYVHFTDKVSWFSILILCSSADKVFSAFFPAAFSP